MVLLASASPRRSDLLKAAGIPFEVVATDVDETPLDDETPHAHVRRLAEHKARAAAARQPAAVVLGADTVVVIDGRILGKPRNSDDAAAMLRALSGRAHEVLTGVCVVRRDQTPAGRQTAPAAQLARASAAVDVACTRVWFATLSDDEIDWYVRSGEPLDKAGAYAIQGLGSRFVERIDGSYSNVVGLPVGLVYKFLRDLPEIRQARHVGPQLGPL